MIFGIIAYVLAINSTYLCNYWTANTDPTQIITGDLGIGLFSYEGKGSDGQSYCYTYTQELMQSFWDGPFIAAYVLAILANTCIGITMLLLFILGCANFETSVLKGIGAASIFGGLFMALTFVSYMSFIMDPPFNATFSVASGTAIAASVVAIIAGLLICSAPPAQPPLEQTGVPAFAPGTVTTTETVMPDGSKKIVKTTVNPDGSQTVTETIEQLA